MLDILKECLCMRKIASQLVPDGNAEMATI
jgi:hypothetical protein